MATERRRSPPPCRRSPTPSATRPGAGSTCSPATTAPTMASRRQRWPSEVGVHPNVARHHLDKLAAGGYLEVAVRPHRRRQAPGRPSKRYLAVADAIDRRSRCAATISCCRCSAGRSSCSRRRSRAMAEQVGAEYGRAMAAGFTGEALAAGQRSMRVGDAGRRRRARRPTASPPTPSSRNDRLRIINDHCPFGDVAHRAPGDLRRRPRHGARACSSELYDGELGVITTESSRPAATRSARPPSDCRSGPC